MQTGSSGDPRPAPAAVQAFRRIDLRLVILLAFAGAAAVLLYVGRDQTVRGDALYYAGRLGSEPFLRGVFHSPANKYLVAAPLVLYDGMFHAFGLSADLPYRIVSTALVLLCGWLFFVLARRRIGFAAIVPTVLLLLLGTGWETVLTVIRLPSLIATAAGLAALILLDRDGPRDEIWAGGLLSLAVLSHPGGLPYVAAAAVIVACRARERRWTSVLTVVPAIVIYGSWYLFLRVPSTPSLAAPTGLGDVISFAAHSWVTLVADVSGLAMVTAHPSYAQAINQLAAGALLGALVVVLAVHRRQVAPRFLGLLLALAISLCSARLSPGGAFRTPDATRYLHAEVVLFLLVTVELISITRPKVWVLGLSAAALGLGLIYNLDALRGGGATARFNSQVALGAYSAYDLAGSQATRSHAGRSGGGSFAATGASPRDYERAADAFGHVGLSSAELSTASGAARRASDSALAQVLDLTVVGHGKPLPASGRAPVAVPTGSGRVAPSRGPCLTLAPPRAGQPDASIRTPARPQFRGAWALRRAIAHRPLQVPVVPLLGKAVPRTDRLLIRGDLATTAVLAGREFDPPSALLNHEGTGSTATVDLPTLPGGRWRLEIGADSPVTVCGARR